MLQAPAAAASVGRPAAFLLRVFEHMQRNPSVSARAAAAQVGISAPPVAKALELHAGNRNVA
jgi:hypothetical protein